VAGALPQIPTGSSSCPQTISLEGVWSNMNPWKGVPVSGARKRSDEEIG